MHFRRWFLPHCRFRSIGNHRLIQALVIDRGLSQDSIDLVDQIDHEVPRRHAVQIRKSRESLFIR